MWFAALRCAPLRRVVQGQVPNALCCGIEGSCLEALRVALGEVPSSVCCIVFIARDALGLVPRSACCIAYSAELCVIPCVHCLAMDVDGLDLDQFRMFGAKKNLRPQGVGFGKNWFPKMLLSERDSRFRLRSRSLLSHLDEAAR